jgi:hypothetical protein
MATNQLDIIDVSDLEKPRLIKTLEMINPHGLGVKDSTLYLCEGDFGLKTFNIHKNDFFSDNREVDLTQLSFNENMIAKDVIPLENTIIVVGDSTIHQFDSSDPANLVLLSQIK